MAKLYFRYGAMGSSKTANALMVQYNYEERAQNALLVKPETDTRYGTKTVHSRMGLESEAILFHELNDLDLHKYNAIIVDEAQFLSKSDVLQLVSIVDDYGIPVICYGLRTDFQGNLFEGSEALFEYADAIEEIKTVCWCGRKATFNARLDADGRVIKDGAQIAMGANGSYTALCRKHWMQGKVRPEY